jgi:hypothetical protein
MIADVLNTFADDLALNTGAAGNYLLGDTIDLRAALRGIGATPGLSALYLVVTVQTTATSGGAATLAIDVIGDDNTGMASPAVLFTAVPATPVAQLTAGKLLCVIALPVIDTLERYLGIRQTTGVAAFTAGKINAFLTTTPPARFAYPDGI